MYWSEQSFIGLGPEDWCSSNRLNVDNHYDEFFCTFFCTVHYPSLEFRFIFKKYYSKSP